MKKYLIVNPFGIGDVLFTTPIIKALKSADPGCVISYWCNCRVKEIIEDSPELDKIFSLSRGDLKKIFKLSFFRGLRASVKLAARIKKEKFDLALDFSHDHRYGLLLKIVGVPKRIGLDYKKGYSGRHMVDYYAQVLDLIGIKSDFKHLSVTLNKESIAKAQDIIANVGIERNETFVAIAPGAGASWGKDASLKHWPIYKYAQLIDKLIDHYKVKVVILGEVAERKIADELLRLTKHPIVDLVGKTSVKSLAALISRAALLVTNDGGPLHVAASLDIKTVSIFGPVDERVYGPYPASDKHIVITNQDISCRPCYKNFRLEPCINEKSCIEDIRVEEVFSAVKLLLSK